MNFFIMKKWFGFLLSVMFLAGPGIFANEIEPENRLAKDLIIPFERPIGFTINLGSITSMTFEGRFILGLLRNISLVIAPSYQNTPEIPLYDPADGQWTLFDFKRFNTGLGVRGHFYEYDSWDGYFIEGMARGGMTWLGKDDGMWSFIPSLIIGYSTVYDSGYSVSFGLGFEYELLLGDAGPNGEFLRNKYFGISKVPFTGELSLGWMW